MVCISYTTCVHQMALNRHNRHVDYFISLKVFTIWKNKSWCLLVIFQLRQQTTPIKYRQNICAYSWEYLLLYHHCPNLIDISQIAFWEGRKKTEHWKYCIEKIEISHCHNVKKLLWICKIYIYWKKKMKKKKSMY